MRELLASDLSQALQSAIAGGSNGVNQMVDAMHDRLFDDVLSQSQPLIGNALKLKDTASDQLNALTTKFYTAMQSLQSLSEIRSQDVQQALFDQLRTLMPTIPNAAAIPVLGDKSNEVSVRLPLSGVIVDKTVPFNPSLPFVLNVTGGNVRVVAGYSTDIVLGFSTTLGPFLDLASNEDVRVSLNVTSPNLNVTGRLGFLKFTATNAGNPDTGLTATLGVNLSDGPDAEARLTAPEIASLGVSASVSGSAAINLNLKTEMGDGDATLPSISTNLRIDWPLSGLVTTPLQSRGVAPTIAFNNIQLHLGEFFTKFAGPIFEQVNDALAPLDPVFDALTQRMPVLSDISLLRFAFDSNRDGEVTLLEALERASGEDLTLIQALVDFHEISDSVTSLGTAGAIPMGSFDIGSDMRQTPALSIAQKANMVKADLTDTQAMGFVQKLHSSSFGGGFSFPILENRETVFDILLGRNVDLFKLDLPELRAGFELGTSVPVLGPLGIRLDGNFDVGIDVGFGFDTSGLQRWATTGFDDEQADLIFDGMYVRDIKNGDDIQEAFVEARIQVSVDVGIGLASAGLGGAIIANVGLDLKDPNGDGKLRPQEIIENIAAHGPICGLFDFGGSLDAALTAYVNVPAGPFAIIEESIDIVRVRLIDFNFGCRETPPVLAELDPETRELKLNVGPRAYRRLNLPDADPPESAQIWEPEESYKITRIGVDQATGLDILQVRAFGHTEVHVGVASVSGDAGIGNDVIELGRSVTASVFLRGGFGDDILIAGAGGGILFGDEGNDELASHGGMLTANGGAGDDLIHGGAGNDILNGADGNDILFGQAGDDYLVGGLGDDLLIGGDGNDEMFGNEGHDDLRGQFGDDRLLGGDGNDIVRGDSGNNEMFGGSGNDVLHTSTSDQHHQNPEFRDGRNIARGEDGDDIIETGSGNDEAFGGPGNDRISTGAGNDLIIGGDGNDEIYGGSGADTIHGDAGDDRIRGGGDPMRALSHLYDMDSGVDRDLIHAGDGSDVVDGGPDVDLIFGEAGNDLLRGGLGVDTIYGAAGIDEIYGDGGDDELYGDDDHDYVSGGAGADRIRGGSGDDRIDGDADNDAIFGEAGNDIANGGSGDDLIDGGIGDDELTGDAGADRVYGGEGNDRLYGHSHAGTNDDNATDELFGGVGDDWASGGGGDDVLFGEAGVDVLHGNDGHDRLFAGTGIGDALFGGRGDDWIVGSDEGAFTDPDFNDLVFFGDVIFGGEGADTVRGLGGADTIYAEDDDDNVDSGAGTDFIRGGNGNDVLYAGVGFGERIEGESGDDVIYGSDLGADVLLGGSGNDRLFGQGFNDTLFGGDGDDELDGGVGTDELFGEDGFDTLFGGGGVGDLLDGGAGGDTLHGSADGADIIRGGAGRDTAFGYGGSDSIDGGSDDDILEGGDGDDLLIGGAGSDLLIGGAQHDTLYGHVESGASDDAAVDFLYGDFGTNRNEANSGRDRLFGQSGNDRLWGEGDDDFLDVGIGNSHIVDYGSGESAIPSDFVTPTPTAAPSLLARNPITWAGATLSIGTETAGRWSELGSSGTATGLSRSPAAAEELTMAIDAAGVRYAAWSDARSGNYEIYVAKYVIGTGWQEMPAASTTLLPGGSAREGGLSNSSESSRRPSLAIGADNQPIVAWMEGFGDGGDIRAAKFDPTAFSGAGGWIALGSSLSLLGVSGTGRADHPQLINTVSGPVVAWLDSSVIGRTNVFIKRFDGTNWNGLGGAASASLNGLTGSAVPVTSFSLTTDGHRVAVAWTQPNAAGSDIYFTEFNSMFWSPLSSSASGQGVSQKLGRNQTPAVAYLGDDVFVAWQGDASVRPEIFARTFKRDMGTWTSIGNATTGVSQTQGLASEPQLVSRGGRLTLAWIEEARANRRGLVQSAFVSRWNGTAFVPDASGDQLTGGITTTLLVQDLTLTADASGRPQIGWMSPARNANGIASQQVFLRADLALTGGRRFVAGGGTTVQSLLDAFDLEPGDRIDVTSDTAGFNITAQDSGVTIVGLPGTRITSQVTVTNATDVALQSMQFDGSVLVNGGSRITIADSTLNAGTTITGTADAQFIRNSTSGSVTGLALDGALRPVIRANQFSGAEGVRLFGTGSTDISLRENTFRAANGISIQVASTGVIGDNEIANAQTGITIAAAFGGVIERNHLHSNQVGIAYSAAAALSDNRVRLNTTGVVATVASATSAFGFVASTLRPVVLPNEISDNVVGVRLNGGRMQSQVVRRNGIGVTGTGELVATEFDHANTIELNTLGVDLVGSIQFNRIVGNSIGIAATNSQLIAHNVISRNTQAGIRVVGRTSTRVVNNTLYSPVGDLLVAEQNSRELFVSGNVFWAEAGTAMKIDDSSQTGFWSDFNLLHSSGAGKLVSWSGYDFTDILDWQQDVGLFDLHSHGRTVVNPTSSEPRFVGRATDDLRTHGLKAGLRSTDPTVDAADLANDLGLPVASMNLLTNSSFESGLSGWVTNPQAAATNTGASAFMGASVLATGNVPTGFVAQDVDLSSFATTDLDSGRLRAVFSGRVRSTSESLPDAGRVMLKFYDASNQLLHESAAEASTTTDRWSLHGGAVIVPAGARRVEYRFESVRNSGASNDAFLDHAVLRIQAAHVAPDLGAFGNTDADVVLAGSTPLAVPRLALRAPDLYMDVQRDELHTIRWQSLGNTSGRSVKIDLYRDGVHGPEFLVNIAAAAADTGSLEWMPAAFGIGYGTHGLRVQIQLVSDGIVLDRSTEPFSVVENTTTFFVNDRAIANDEWTSEAGDNRNTGRIASSPKPFPSTILRTYSLSAGSTLFLDTADYRMFQPLVVSNSAAIGDDEGFLFTGPTSVARVAKLSHANPLYTPAPVMTLSDADEMRLTKFSTEGGTHGLLIHNGSELVTASDLKIRGASSDGLRFESTAIGSTFARITAQNNVGAGIRVTGPVDSIRQSEVQWNQSAGISLTAPGDVVLTQNLVAGNYGTGIFVTGGTPTIGNADLTLSLGNRVLNNRLDGIVVTDTLAGIVAGNAVSGHGAGAGIRFGGQIQNNVASGNLTGIDGSVVIGNRVYGSTSGIILRAFGLPTLANENIVYSNVTGLIVNARTQPQLVRNNLLYANSDTALEVRGAVQVINNTIHTSAVGIRATASPTPVSDLQLRNNIIMVMGNGLGIAIPSSSQTGFVSDFNLIHTTARTAHVGEWQGVRHVTLRSWQQATFGDVNSLTSNPLFVDADGADNVLGASTSSDGRDDSFHVSSEFGSVKVGGLAPVIGVFSGRPEFQAVAFSNDATTSPALDRGAATDVFVNEPTPNGNYINLGAYGNTVQASRSPLTYVLVTSPNGEEVWPGNQTFPIRWRAESLTGSVRIELLDSDYGFRALIADSTANDGEFLWTVPPALAAEDHQIRITRLDATGAVDESDDYFATTAAIRSYYVNDAFVNGAAIPAEWTTAAGNDANDGLSPATPKASIRAVLEAYDLEPDDVIFVDVGTYNLTANIVIGAQDSGVEIRGYYSATFRNEQNPVGDDTHLLTVLNRGNQAAGSYVFQFTGADDVTLNHLAITGANIGVVALNGADSDRIAVRSSEFRGLAAAGALIEASNDGPQFFGNRVSTFGQHGLRLTATNAATIRDNVVFGINDTNTFGIDVTSETGKPEGNLVEANHVYAVGTGIRTVAGSTTAGLIVRGNRVHDTRTTGISGGGVDVIEGNTVYDNQAIGISASFVTGNTVFGNQTGIQGGSGVVSGNRVYRNVTGIAGGSSSVIAENRVYSNTTGMTVGNTTARNNLVYDNAADEIVAGFSSVIQNNTVHHSAGGNGIRVSSQNTRLLNNIIQVDDGTAIVVETAGQSGFASNYNLLRLDEDAFIGRWGTTSFASLEDWTNELNLDRDSCIGDPLFVNTFGHDDWRGFSSAAVQQPQLLDNGGLGFSVSGSWDHVDQLNGVGSGFLQSVVGANGYWPIAGSVSVSPLTTTTISGTWPTHRGLGTASYSYSVSAAYTVTYRRADNSQYEVNYTIGFTGNLDAVNQEAPRSSFSQTVALPFPDYSLVPNVVSVSPATVTGTIGISGTYVVADRITGFGGSNDDVDFVANPGGWVRAGVDGDYHRRPADESSGTASWEFNGLTNGDYSIAADWTAFPGNTINATFAIYDGDRLVRWFTKNQSPGNPNGTVLGIATISSGRLTVRLSGAGNLQADSIRITQIAGDHGADDDYRTLAGSAAIDFGDPASAFSLEPAPNGGRVNAGHTGNSSLAAVSDMEVVQILSPNGREKLEQGSDVSIRWRSDGLVDPRGTYASVITADAPLAWYRLGERSGTAAADSSGNNRAGTYFGSPVLGSGGAMAAESDTAIRIASTNGGVTIPYSAAMSPPQLTVEAWINPDATIGSFNNLITRSNFGNGFDGYGLMWYESKLRFHVNNYSGLGSVDVPVTTGQWSHVVATYDGTALRLYVNGTLVGSTNYSTPISYANYQTTIGGTWRGGIDEVALYDRALTSAQITAHYQRGTRDVYGTVMIAAYRPAQPDVVHVITESTPADGQFTWTVPTGLVEGLYRLRVTQQEGLQATDESDATVQIVSAGNHYYINDSSLVGDVFASAIGSNANSGKSPDQPMASLAALLRAYDLDPGDVIHVDAGTYLVHGNIVIDAQDSGVRIEGPVVAVGVSAGAQAVLNRSAQNNSAASVFELQNADDLTITGLTFTNAGKAIYAAFNSDSDRLTISKNQFIGNATGVEVSSTNDNTTVTETWFLNNSLAVFGQSVSGMSVIRNGFQSTASANVIRITTAGSDAAVVQNNSIDGAYVAVDVTGAFLVAHNTIQNVTSTGVQASTSMAASTIARNHVAGTGAANSTGIRQQGGTSDGNDIVSMSRGIDVFSGGVAKNNRVMNSSLAGIVADSSTVRGNTVYSNAVGVVATGATRIENNLIYDNGTDGIWIRSGSGSVLENNTIVQTSTGDAVQIGGINIAFSHSSQIVSQATLRNNILLAGSGYALHVAADSQLGFSSDFNLFHMPANGKVVKWEDREFQLRTEWSFATGFDANSRQGDPQFENPIGADGIIGYRTSDARDYGFDDDFRVRSGSVSIDAGASTSTSSVEPAPNGGRINLGHTGNTSLATTSPDRTVQLLSPNGLEKLEAGVPVTVRWRSNGLRNGGVTTPTVNIEITRDAGATWFTLATSLPVDADGNGSWSWTPTGVSAGNDVLLRVTANVLGSPQDVSDDGFLITNNDRHFYINDTTQTGDVFTTQIGSDASSGKSPDRPMLTLAALLRAYDLEPGDVIHVDAGNYRVYSNIVLTLQDSGVRIEGPGAIPAGRVLPSIATFNRGNTLPGSSVIELSDIDDAVIDNLSVTGAEIGIFAATTADSDRVQITNNTIFSNRLHGISIEAGVASTHSDDIRVIGNRVSNHADFQSAGIRVRSVRARVEGNEVFGNQDGIVVFADPVWTSVRSVVSGNLVRNNLRYGISALELVQVIGNTAYGQLAATGAGIHVSTTLQTTEVTDNVAWQNAVGIRGESFAAGFQSPGVLQVRNNRVYANTRGVLARGRTRVDGNQVFSNSIGISGDGSHGFNGAIVNNVVYANANQGIFIERSVSDPGQILNNTIRQIVGDAIRLDNVSAGFAVRNNILVVDAGRGIVVSSGSQSGFVSNSNLFALTAGSHAGFWNNANQTSLSQWVTASTQDNISLTGDPRFVDADGADNILGFDSITNRDGSADDNFHVRRSSDAIDRANGTFAPTTDRDGRVRSDDPGTTNNGTPVNLAFADIGAYEFAGSSLDVTAPTVVSAELEPSGPLESQSLSLLVTFSEPIDTLSVRSMAAWDFRSTGANGLLGDQDDVVLPLAVRSGTATHQVRFELAGVSTLPPGILRLLIHGDSGPTDLSGNALDGDANGTAGGTWSRTNSAPQLATVADTNATEHVPVQINTPATDPDAGQSLTWTLESGAPAGATFDPAAGQLNWTPSESDGGTMWTVVVRVTDNSDLRLSHRRAYRIIVQEVNSVPVIASVPTQSLRQGGTLTIQLSATDTDVPVQNVVWGLSPSAPNGTSIDPVTGLLTWATNGTIAVGDHEIPIFVYDDAATPAFQSAVVRVTITAPPRPVISEPIGLIESHYPQYSWSDVPEAIGYELWVSSLTTGASPLILVTTQNTSHFENQPLGIGRYRVWVRTLFDNNVQSAWSAPRDFRINVRPQVDYIDRRQSTARPTITWQPVPGAVRYDIWVNNVTTQTSEFVRDQNVMDASWTPTADLPLGVYRLWVRAIDAAGVATRWSVYSEIVAATAPTLSSPGAATFDRTPTFVWQPVAGADTYEIQVRNRQQGITVYTVPGIGTTSWTPPTELSDGFYRWWVLARSNRGIVSYWSPGQDVYIGGRPVVFAPSGSVETSTPLFNWSPVDGAARYELWVTDIITVRRVIYLTTLTTTSFTPATALPNSTFRVWVRAVSASGEFSPWSVVSVFSIGGDR